MDLSNSQILITGASSGFGAEFARQLHGFGAKLLLVARREDRLRELREELNSVRADSTEYQVVDLSTYDERFESLIKRVKEEFFQVLINNAGFGSLGRFEKLPLDRELDMVRVNAMATLRLSQAVIPAMKQRREGCIVSISSIAGFQPLPYMATYAATKAFNYQHSLALREELRSFGIRVITVCPGPVATEFGKVSGFKRSMPGLPSDTAAKVVSETISAMRTNKRLIVPGLGAKLLSWGATLVPRCVSTRLAGYQNAKMIEE